MTRLIFIDSYDRWSSITQDDGFRSLLDDCRPISRSTL